MDKNNVINMRVKELFVIAKKYEDPLVQEMFLKAAKEKIKQERITLYKLTKYAQNIEGMELRTYGEAIIEKSCDNFQLVSRKGIQKIIDAVNLEYVMKAYKESKIDIIKEEALSKINKVFEEIENDCELRKELREKIMKDERELELVKRR